MIKQMSKKTRGRTTFGAAVVSLFGFLALSPSALAQSYPECKTPTAPEGVETVAMELELKTGTVELELRPDLAPKHVERITSLADKGFYDDVVFHRVIEGFMAQTGDPTARAWVVQTSRICLLSLPTQIINVALWAWPAVKTQIQPIHNSSSRSKMRRF